MIGNKEPACEPKIEREREVDASINLLKNSVKALQDVFSQLEYRLSAVLPTQEEGPSESYEKVTFNVPLADEISAQVSAIQEMMVTCERWIKKIGI